MRKKRLVWNTLSSFLLQATAIVSGFILPRIIIETYGSEVNGLVNSITQFIGFIAFLELGVGAVIQSALYEPLANNDKRKISEIVASGQKFFSFVARILLLYIIVLLIVYPVVVNQNFGWIYTASLIIIISLSAFAQYYYGIVNALLLTADQHGYVQYLLSAITLLINTACSVILIKLGFSIHIVKLVSSVFFIIKPVILKLYVDKHYQIERGITYEVEPLTQKWNGIAQHVAAIVLENTDTVVLSIFSTLSNVSIYSVYHLVIYGVKRIFDTITNGIMALMGELWAKQEIEELKKVFSYTEWIVHTLTVLLFGCVAVLICPFISVYTKGITDADYIVPSFAFVLTIAHAAHCLRMPYLIMILAGNHYKQTQINFIVAAFLNLSISIVTVHFWGLIGVAIGTLVAMVYQTVWLAIYLSHNLLKWPIRNVVKQGIIDTVSFITGYFATKNMVMTDTTYSQWLQLAIKTAIIWSAIIFVINYVFYHNNMKTVVNKMQERIKRFSL